VKFVVVTEVSQFVVREVDLYLTTALVSLTTGKQHRDTIRLSGVRSISKIGVIAIYNVH